MAIADNVSGHLRQLFAEMAETIERLPDDVWRRQDDSRPLLHQPRFIAHHMVWCMALPHLLRVPLDRMPHNIFPDYKPGTEMTKRQVLDILDDIRAYAEQTYAPMTDEAYLAGDEKGVTPLDRVMYTLAHTRQHYGQLVQILRDAGGEEEDWYPLR